MYQRLLDVNAFTTLDVADGRAYGPDWDVEAAAVVDVDTPESGGTVVLSTELDPTGLDHLEPHVDTIRLTPAQARILASELEDAAFDAEPDIGANDGTSDGLTLTGRRDTTSDTGGDA